MGHPGSTGEVVEVLVTGHEEAVDLGVLQQLLGLLNPSFKFSVGKDNTFSAYVCFVISRQ
jgi:hypothetical protein